MLLLMGQQSTIEKMIFRRRKHQVPSLNTTSTADISFMLLIFFLVTTNMDIDKGLSRQLPPYNKEESQESFVSKGTTLDLTITATNKLLVNGEPSRIEGLDKKVETFVNNVGKKHLIKVGVDPQASYESYFQLQNQLVSAYNQLRNQTAQRLFGRPYASLSPARKEQVKEACPQRIAEQYHAEAPSMQRTQQKGGQQ